MTEDNEVSEAVIRNDLTTYTLLLGTCRLRIVVHRNPAHDDKHAFVESIECSHADNVQPPNHLMSLRQVRYALLAFSQIEEILKKAERKND